MVAGVHRSAAATTITVASSAKMNASGIHFSVHAVSASARGRRHQAVRRPLPQASRRQSEGELPARMPRTTDCNDDVLLAVAHVGHRRSGLRRREVTAPASAPVALSYARSSAPRPLAVVLNPGSPAITSDLVTSGLTVRQLVRPCGECRDLSTLDYCERCPAYRRAPPAIPSRPGRDRSP